MSKLGRVTRRVFVAGSAVVAGGVAVGYYVYQREPGNPLLDHLEEGEVSLTPYLKIDQEGVVVIAPRQDVGQGAQSIYAALIAEELGVDIASLRVEHGPPSGAYYNAPVTAEALPIMATDKSATAEAMRELGAVVSKTMGMQITGGSSTVPDAFDRVRRAGAMARALLLGAGAKKSGASVDELRIEDVHVVTPDGMRHAFTELAETAAKVTPPEDIKLKPMSEWRYLGQKMMRTDMQAKIEGRATFGIDVEVPDMLYASARANPHLESKLKSYDASAAETMRGVQKVVPVTNGVAVIADNTWRAFKALDSIQFDWEEASYPKTTDEMFSAVEESITEAHQDSQFRNEGDVDVALGGDDVLDAVYKIPYLAHAPLEPMSAVAQFTKDRFDIWTASQVPMFLLQQLEKITGLSADKIHIHIQLSGGSFGKRLELDYALQAAEIAMAHPGAPIKLTWTREEDMAHDQPRPLAIAKCRGRVKDGGVDAIDLSIATLSVTESQMGRIDQPVMGPDVAIVAGAWDQPFAVPNYRVTGYRTPAMVPVSSWRSVGASGNGFFFNSMFDELCVQADVDPMDEMIRLCSHDASRKTLETLKDLSGWDGRSLGEKRGRGVAFTLSFGVPTAEVVEVTNTDAGIRIDAVYVVMEVGKVLDPVNFENQIQGAIVWGLGHAMNAEITFTDGKVNQSNFHLYEGMRMRQTPPKIIVKGLEGVGKVKGAGEPAVPPAAPALANAIFSATGQRIREMPLDKSIAFV